jgi:hypothetical protein
MGMCFAEVMLVLDRSAFLDCDAGFLRHTEDIVRASHPPENVKRFEIGLVKLLAESRAGIAHDNDFEVAIRCLASRGADADVCNDTRNHDAIDASTAQLRRQIGCRKGAGR